MKWEYLVLHYENQPSGHWAANGKKIGDWGPKRWDLLNQYGAEGWELVAAGDSGFYFKRPL